ncbi:MAG: Trk system potassium transporter TrkA [Alphaproteobacteria bacterium]|jgi:trk system potassium uptake protein TrkA|nr:Trk system potassium transporter TrkA [Alphaproteobacteria bacterium]
MKVLVCGAGQVGFNIARHLSGENNDVTVIDHDQERIRKVSDGLDVQAVLGFASHPDILEQSGAVDADMLIAVTQSDEINMVSCQIAHSLFNVPTKIARVRHLAYLEPAWADLFSRDHLPIDVIISPEAEVVSAVARRLEAPGAIDMTGFADNRVRLVGVRIGETCPIVNTPLRQLTEMFPDLNVTIVYILREDKSIFPHGMDQLLIGDEVYFVVDSGHLGRAMNLFGHEEKEARRLVIVGGGNIGFQLAAQLEKAESGINIKLIEFEKRRAEYVADRLDRTIVLNGDALDTEILEEANISTAETVVVVTDDDQANILVSVLAKRHGCRRAVTLVNATTYAPLISPLGIDAAVSPREITVSRILEHVRRGRIRSVYALRGGEAELIEAEAMETASVVGVPLREARMPKGVLVGALVRGEQVIIPRGDTVIEKNDLVIVFAPHDAVKKVEKLFSVALGFF